MRLSVAILAAGVACFGNAAISLVRTSPRDQDHERVTGAESSFRLLMVRSQIPRKSNSCGALTERIGFKVPKKRGWRRSLLSVRSGSARPRRHPPLNIRPYPERAATSLLRGNAPRRRERSQL